ncbi:hypothetical protein [Microbacterium aurum]
MTIIEAPVSSPRFRLRMPSTAPDPVMLLLVMAFVTLLGTVAAICGTQFFYVGDNPESFIPLWHHFGSELRAGHWWPMEASGWMGGNYAGEAAYAQWNPLLLVAYVVVSWFGHLATAAAVIMIAMLALLGGGAYLLMRTYAVRVSVAAAMSVALPVTGFTLFYEAAGWPAGLAAFVGVTWFWASVRKQTLGRWSPVVTFVFGYLAITTGNPYAVMGVLVVLGGTFIGLLVSRQFREAVELVVTGIAVGTVALLVFLPLLGVQSVTLRQQLAVLGNDTFMVPDLGDLAASSTASYLPTITNWGGSAIETLPSTYLAWFALPLLPWLRWRAFWEGLRTQLDLIIIAGVFAVSVLAPSNVWLFRWPIRLVEYFYLTVLVLLAIAVSHGLKPVTRGRMWSSAVIVAFGAYLAASATPGGLKIHAVGMVLTVVALVALLLTWRRWGTRAAMCVVLAGTLAVTAFQTSAYPRALPVALPPASVEIMESGTTAYAGSVLQLAEQARTDPQAVAHGRILFGNLSAALGYESLNRYTGIGFKAFSDALCMDYKGSTCADAYAALWRPVAHTGGDLATALRIGTLVVDRNSYPNLVAGGPPTGWHEADADEYRVVWVRDDELEVNGRVSGVSSGVVAVSTTSTETAESVDVSAGDEGWVTFARLAWPGYDVHIDGERVDYVTSSEGLLQVRVPAGQSTLTLSYAAPGLTVGWIAAAFGGAISLVLSVFWFARRRQGRAVSLTLSGRR